MDGYGGPPQELSDLTSAGGHRFGWLGGRADSRVKILRSAVAEFWPDEVTFPESFPAVESDRGFEVESDNVLPPIGRLGSSPSKVLVIGNNLLITDALVAVLAQRGFQPRSVVPTLGALLQELVVWKPHVALIEIDPANKTEGFELIVALRETGVTTAVMSSEVSPHLANECIGAGASAVIDTRSPLTDLFTIFRRLTARFVEESVPDHDQDCLGQRANLARLAPFAALTAREKSVLSELMDGRRAEAIARSSWVSISTVRSQIKAILQKLGVNSQLAAVAIAREAGWENEAVVNSAVLELA